MRKPIQVVIEYQHEGTHSLVIKNVWDFVYEIETRILFVTAYRKYYQDENGTWYSDVRVLPGLDDNCEEKLLAALGEHYDRHKVLLIAKAKCLEQDLYMKYNELDCIEVKWWNSKTEGTNYVE
jgi:hypothetical protein